MATDPPRRTTRGSVAGVLLALVAFAVGALASADADLPGAPFPLLDAVAGCAGALAIVRWRHRPLALYVALFVPGVVFPWAAGSSLVALFLVAVRHPLRTAVLAAAAAVPTIPASWLIAPDPQLTFAGAMALALVILAAAVGWGAVVRYRRDGAARAEAEQALEAERIRHAERERIAREMHDVLAHRLSLLSLHAGALEFRPDASRDEIARAAGVIRDNAHQALDELRAVIGALREGDGAAPEPPQPTLVDVARLVEESREAGTPVDERCGVADLGAVPPAVGRHAYRVVQEGLTNARKHAPASAVELVLDGRPGEGLRVALRNRRTARDAAIPGAGSGLAGLAERVALAGGSLRHGPDGDDYRLEAELPWPA